MSRLNTVMKLVTDTRHDNTFRTIPVPRTFTVVVVTSGNNLVFTKYNHRYSYIVRRTIPKKEVVQIVAGFSEIA